MVVGEAPGQREDESHQAFVGPAGQLLTELLADVGIDREDCYITNSCKCRPPNNRAPKRAEVKACATTYLTKEIAKVRPDFVLVLGNTALQATLGKSGITKHRGQVYEVGNVRYFPTFHPAAVLRNPKWEHDVRADLARFARLVRGDAAADDHRTSVKIIRTPAQLRWLCRELDRQSVVAFDLETWQRENLKEVGSREWEEDSKIVTLGLSWKPGTAVVVPIEHSSNPWGGEEASRKVLAKLKPHLERKSLKVVAHNGKYDTRWAAAKRIFIDLTFDTMLAAHLQNENVPKSLEAVANRLFQVDPWDIKNDVDKGDLYNGPLKKICIYNGKDCDWTLRIYFALKEHFRQQKRLARIFTKLMMPASNSLTRVESRGFYLDRKRARKIKKKIDEEVIRAEKHLRSMVPKHNRDTINFNSHPQVAHWLFVDLDLPIIERTPQNAPSSREGVLKRLAHHHGAPEALLAYRGWLKKQQFIDSWLKHADDRSRIHTTYKLFGTVTGRLSSEKPNLQQVPREGIMRTCFGAPKGWKFVEADFSQVELRLAAMVAPEPHLLRIFKTGGDPHATTGAELARMTIEEMLASDATGKTEHRKKAKGVNFGMLYGMGADHFIDYAFENYGLIFTKKEAEDARSSFFRLYPGLVPWHNRQRRLVNRYGYVTSPLGRVRHLPDIRSSDRGVKAEAERQAINSPVQSTASDMMLASMILLDQKLPSRWAWIIGTVHDAIGFQIKDEALEECLPIIKSTMESVDHLYKWFGAEIDVPIEAEVKYGQHWGSGIKWLPQE